GRGRADRTDSPRARTTTGSPALVRSSSLPPLIHGGHGLPDLLQDGRRQGTEPGGTGVLFHLPHGAHPWNYRRHGGIRKTKAQRGRGEPGVLVPQESQAPDRGVQPGDLLGTEGTAMIVGAEAPGRWR